MAEIPSIKKNSSYVFGRGPRQTALAKLYNSISVDDVVNCSRKTEKVDFGIKGYPVKKEFDAYFDRAPNYTVKKEKAKSYIDVIQKEKAKIPSPDKYALQRT